MTANELRRIGFYLDGIRYSLAICDLSATRLQATLDEAARLHGLSLCAEGQVYSAIQDAWSIIDMCHRTRDLIQGTPTLSQRLPGIQIFLRNTLNVEEMRNHVQHFRSGIPALPDNCSPLWGSISWVTTTDQTTCYTIFTGNLLDGVNSSSMTYDLQEKRFTCKVLLSTDAGSVDLISLSIRMQELRICLLKWADDHPNIDPVQSVTPIIKFSLTRKSR